MKKEKLTRQMKIMPAYDKRSDNPKKDYGICSCRMIFAIMGKAGAITVNFFTNWYLPSTIKEYKEKGIYRNLLTGGREPFKTKIDLEEGKTIQSVSWDYHSKKKQYKDHKKYKKCEYIKGGCYTDGSCLRAENYSALLLEKGSEGVFEQLEKDYKTQFKTNKKVIS